MIRSRQRRKSSKHAVAIRNELLNQVLKIGAAISAGDSVTADAVRGESAS